MTELSTNAVVDARPAPIEKRLGFSLADEIAPIMRGEVELPNFKPMPLTEAIGAVAGGAGLVARPDVESAKVPGEDRSRSWARYFLGTTQGGTYDGTGFVIYYATNAKTKRGEGRAARFAICEHENVYEPSANPARGLHDQHCKKCGLDTSVDSSD